MRTRCSCEGPPSPSMRPTEFQLSHELRHARETLEIWAGNQQPQMSWEGRSRAAIRLWLAAHQRRSRGLLLGAERTQQPITLDGAPSRFSPSPRPPVAGLPSATRWSPGRCANRLALDDVHRHALPRGLDRVRVTELMRCKPPTDSSLRGELAELSTSGGGRPPPAACRAIDDAEQRADREPDAVSKPGSELLKTELVHPGFAPLVAFVVTGTASPCSAVCSAREMTRDRRRRSPTPRRIHQDHRT
jgi:hypothetical protein